MPVDPDNAREQVQGVVDALENDPEALRNELETMMDNYPEGHPISEAAYAIAVERNLI